MHKNYYILYLIIKGGLEPVFNYALIDIFQFNDFCLYCKIIMTISRNKKKNYIRIVAKNTMEKSCISNNPLRLRSLP